MWGRRDRLDRLPRISKLLARQPAPYESWHSQPSPNTPYAIIVSQLLGELPLSRFSLATCHSIDRVDKKFKIPTVPVTSMKVFDKMQLGPNVFSVCIDITYSFFINLLLMGRGLCSGVVCLLLSTIYTYILECVACGRIYTSSSSDGHHSINNSHSINFILVG